jgi:hypothetical protein
MNIYKTVFDTEEQGKEVLIEKGVWEEVIRRKWRYIYAIYQRNKISSCYW